MGKSCDLDCKKTKSHPAMSLCSSKNNDNNNNNKKNQKVNEIILYYRLGKGPEDSHLS
jgi:hypothetical protein